MQQRRVPMQQRRAQGLCQQRSTAPFKQAASRATRLAAASSSSPSSSAPTAPSNPLLMAAVETLFSFKPFFSAASKNARNMIVKRAETLGVDWTGTMAKLQAQDWSSRIKAVENPDIVYPDYYTKPFHAYSQGNLCWEAALEVTMAAQSVHAPVMDPDGKKMDPHGDAMLRSNYSAKLHECLEVLGKDRSTIKDIVDLGAATGLSSLELLRAFPGSRVTALDLSPHFVAVGKYEQQQREAKSGSPEPLTLSHGVAERTGLPDSSQDLVSMCLVCHELPQAATKAIFREAFRVLRPGGVLSIMEMDPTTPAFARVLKNPFAYTAFKSTEPWLQEYMALDMDGAMVDAGFNQPQKRNSTPRHKTVVAIKP